MVNRPETAADALRRACQLLSGPDDNTEAGRARVMLEASELVCAVTGKSRAALLAYPNAPVDTERLNALLARRCSGEPLAYVLGQWDFYGYTFAVDRRVLIPRDDSETVLEAFLDALPASGPLKLLDLCTGSGCLGIAAVLELAKKRIAAEAVLADLSGDALAVAAQNAASHGLTGRVRTAPCDAFHPETLAQTFDGCICNPPYIRRGELQLLDRSVADFEPAMALDGGSDGLDFYRALAVSLRGLLKAGAPLTFEVGYDQAGDVADLLRASGWTGVTVRPDLQGIMRAVTGFRSRDH